MHKHISHPPLLKTHIIKTVLTYYLVMMPLAKDGFQYVHLSRWLVAFVWATQPSSGW